MMNVTSDFKGCEYIKETVFAQIKTEHTTIYLPVTNKHLKLHYTTLHPHQAIVCVDFNSFLLRCVQQLRPHILQ